MSHIYISKISGNLGENQPICQHQSAKNLTWFPEFFKYRNGSNFFMSSWDLSQFTLNYPIFSEKSNHPNTHTYAHWCRKRFPVSIRDILYVTHIFSDWLYMYDICNMHVLCTYLLYSTQYWLHWKICNLLSSSVSVPQSEANLSTTLQSSYSKNPPVLTDHMWKNHRMTE